MTRRGRIAVGALLGLVAAGAAGLAVRARHDRHDERPPAAVHEAPVGRSPEGLRVRVQVLNATRTRGLALRATRFLRSRGYDVVELGTAREQRDSTLVLDRSGHPEWARSVAELLEARSESRRDSSRYVDVTVLLGSSWRPPVEAFDP